MIRYKVKNKLSQLITNQWTDDFAGSDYYESGFGKKIRWVKIGEEDVSHALENRTIIDIAGQAEVLDSNGNIIQEEIPEVTHVEYLLDAEYEILQEDASIQDNPIIFAAYVNDQVALADSQVSTLLQGFDKTTQLSDCMAAMYVYFNVPGTFTSTQIAQAKVTLDSNYTLYSEAKAIQSQMYQNIAAKKTSLGL